MYQTTYHRPSSVDEAAALFAQGGDGFFADGFAAERASAVSRIDEAGIR